MGKKKKQKKKPINWQELAISAGNQCSDRLNHRNNTYHNW